MRLVLAGLLLPVLTVTAHAMASTRHLNAPEIDGSAGVAAMAAVASLFLLLRDRRSR